MIKRIVLVIFITAAVGVAVLTLPHLTRPVWERWRQSQNDSAKHTDNTNAETGSTKVDTWAEAVEKVKADRSDLAGKGGAFEIPPELRHYNDRHWFLATQVAEIGKYNIQTCQDYMDLAAMIERGTLVTVPAVTTTYVLFGVGAKADDGVFTRYEDDHSIELYSAAQLGDAYKRLDDKRSDLQAEITALKVQSGTPNKRERPSQRQLQKQITERQQELKTMEENKALLDQFYGQPDSRQKLFRDYESLQALARSFGGRYYNLEDPSDRLALKLNMLASLRPEALKILEEIASAYHHQFDRPLPVSSLVRPEQYQHALHRVNRNAVLIDAPPHSTGLAFDIDYRYMSVAEQMFLMTDLACLKNEGRIEVLRERNANYHVFAFIKGVRPSDDLITASLEKAGAPVEEVPNATGKAANAKNKLQKAKNGAAKQKIRKRHR